MNGSIDSDVLLASALVGHVAIAKSFVNATVVWSWP